MNSLPSSTAKMSVLNHGSYRTALRQWLSTSHERGAQRQLASAARCSPSWISRVLSGRVQLTPDQALGVANFIGLEGVERDYFLLLVDLERAITPALKQVIEDRLANLKRRSLKLHTSIKSSVALSKEQQEIYFRSWSCAAAHVACMIAPMSSAQLSRRLAISPRTLSWSLRQLEKMKLIRLQDGLWSATNENVHLPATAELGAEAHRNWRIRVCQELENRESKGLHYSAIHCLSRKDIDRIQKLLKDAILSCRAVIDGSSADTLGILCVDWFEL